MPTIKLFGNLRQIAGAPQWTLPAENISSALSMLCSENAELQAAILDNGALRPHVRVMVNGLDIELGLGLDTPLDPNDQVAIFPPIAGGEQPESMIGDKRYGRLGR